LKYDIFFLSYQESNAESNWRHLSQLHPHAQRIHGIQGIKQAHQKIAAQATTDFFFVVDGDNSVMPDFLFPSPQHPDQKTLYVWRAQNPVNDLCYGFGGIKLYNKWLLLDNTKETQVDIATSIAPKYVAVPVIASITHFNASPLESWRAGFRETAKLTLNTLKNPLDTASAERLVVWTTKGADRLFGEDCLRGARQGHSYALEYHQEPSQMARLNDFNWLSAEYAR